MPHCHRSESYDRMYDWPPNRVGARLWSGDSRLLLSPRLFGSFPRLCVAVWKTPLTIAKCENKGCSFARQVGFSRLPDCLIQSGLPPVECPTVSPTLFGGQDVQRSMGNPHQLAPTKRPIWSYLNGTVSTGSKNVIFGAVVMGFKRFSRRVFLSIEMSWMLGTCAQVHF